MVGATSLKENDEHLIYLQQKEDYSEESLKKEESHINLLINLKFANKPDTNKQK